MYRRPAALPTVSSRAAAGAPHGDGSTRAAVTKMVGLTHDAILQTGAPVALSLLVCAVALLSLLLRATPPPPLPLPLALPSPPPLRVAVYDMWLDASAVMSELDVLSRIALVALGRPLVPVDTSLPRGEQLDSADVILFGPYGDRARSGKVARNYSTRAITVFIGSENTPSYADAMVGDVAVSLGHARNINAPSYLRMPWWLPYCLDGDAPPGLPQFSPLLRRRVDPNEWMARPRAAALLSSHYAFPRPQLFEMLSTAAGLRVDAPGKAFHNMEWPRDLPNSHLNGKVEFLTSARFNVCPESGKTGKGGGYTTEKLAQALMAGTVPIYWGDSIDAQVFNPRRVIVYDGSNNASVLATVYSLEHDAQFREAWFSSPALAAGADSWLTAWSQQAGQLLKRAADGERMCVVCNPPCTGSEYPRVRALHAQVHTRMTLAPFPHPLRTLSFHPRKNSHVIIEPHFFGRRGA